MLTIDITRWWQQATPNTLRCTSGSQAELGAHAGSITWGNALIGADLLDPLTDEQAALARDYFRGFGAWSDAELDAMDARHLLAMLLQEVAHSARMWDMHSATTRAEWPMDQENLTLAQQMVDNREGPPLPYPAEWGADGFPARITAEFCS